MNVEERQNRLPPGQQWVAPGKWPLIGEREPADSSDPWVLEITGMVDQPIQFDLDQLRSLPQTDRVLDIHCVTRWSMPDVLIRGVLLQTLLEKAKSQREARYVSFESRSERNHSTSLELKTALDLGTIVALEMKGQPLGREHGGPFRNIVPGRYFYKSVKWLTRIELLAEDKLGYWEAETGYHNTADPWKEQRYMVPNLDRRTVKRLLESRDFSGHDLRSLNASERNLDGLQAHGSLLRDANFERASLVRADFTDANLSNAHLASADLREATFLRTDLEGADLSGANLCGADLTGCSLIGASFCQLGEGHDPAAAQGAIFDRSTRLPRDLLQPLTPVQQAYVESQLSENPE